MSHAQNPPSCEDQARIPSGTIVGTGKSLGFFIGIRTGNAIVTLHSGETFKVMAKGVKAMEFGASETRFVGIVYNLKTKADIEGEYTAASYGTTAGTLGAGGFSLTNTKCVVIEGSVTDSKGLKLSMPNLGVIGVTLEK